MSMDLLVRLPDPEEIKKKYPASENVKKIKVQRDKEIACLLYTSLLLQ